MQARAVAAQSFSATVQPQQASQLQIQAPPQQQSQESQQQQPPPPVTPAPAGKVSIYQFTIINFCLIDTYIQCVDTNIFI